MDRRNLRPGRNLYRQPQPIIFCLTPQITWDLSAFKARLNTQHGVNAILIAYNKLQPCGPAEIQDFQSRLAAAPVDTEILYNLCHFPAPWEEDQITDYKNALAKVVNAAPNQFALTLEVVRSGVTTQGVSPKALKQELRLIRLLMSWAWLVPVVLLLLILALAVRSLRDLGRFWGVPLVVAALVSLIPALTYQAWITALLAMGPLSETPPIIFTEASRSIIRLAAHIFQPLLIQALILLGLGIALVVSMLVSKKKAQPSG